MKAGDIVRLKSGGCLMTVESVGSGDGALCACAWFKREASGVHEVIWSGPRRAKFVVADTLEIVEDK